MSHRQTIVDLSRLYVNIGRFDPNTPLCAIIQVGKCMAIDIAHEERLALSDPKNVHHLINKIMSREIRRITFKGTISHLEMKVKQLVACFVNSDPGLKWDNSTLEAAFFHTISFRDGKDYDVDPNFQMGFKTPENPHNYDPCILYRICLDKGLRTTRSTTMEEMADMVRASMEDRKQIVTSIESLVQNLATRDLIAVRTYIASLKPTLHIPTSVTTAAPPKAHTRDIPDKDIKSWTADVVGGIHRNFRDYMYLINRFNPTTHEDAIGITAFLFGIDITDSLNPLKQYREIRRLADIQKIGEYVPIGDPIFSTRYLSNPTWYRINAVWNPKFNAFYGEDAVTVFANDEGYHPDSMESAEGFLAMSRVTPTFHMGIVPQMITSVDQKIETVIGKDPILEVDQDSLISYGISEITDRSELPIILTAEELTSYFKSVQNFTNPGKAGEQISKIAITKLKRICETRMAQESKTIAKEFSNLLEVIVDIEKKSIEFNKEARELKTLYDSSDSSRENIAGFLGSVLELGMYMRGWRIPRYQVSDPNNFPLAERETHVESGEENSGLLMSNVAKAIGKLEAAAQKEVCLSQLPLIVNVTNADGEVEYIVNRDDDKGLTIMDRVRICKVGETVHACIRLSSSHLLASYSFYALAVGIIPPFNIKNIAYIS